VSPPFVPALWARGGWPSSRGGGGRWVPASPDGRRRGPLGDAGQLPAGGGRRRGPGGEGMAWRGRQDSPVDGRGVGGRSPGAGGVRDPNPQAATGHAQGPLPDSPVHGRSLDRGRFSTHSNLSTHPNLTSWRGARRGPPPSRGPWGGWWRATRERHLGTGRRRRRYIVRYDPRTRYISWEMGGYP
jgi:hypothetical protein